MGPSKLTLSLEPVDAASISGRLGPFAMYFPSGFQPGKHADCRWEVHTDKAKPHQHYVIGRTDEVDFVGNTHASSTAGKLPCRYALAVLDKESGKLTYSEVESGRILRMEPRARSLDFAPSNKGAMAGERDRAQQLQQNRRLVEAFGSTRRKRQLDTREGAAVQVDAVGGAEAVKLLLKDVGDKAAAAGATKDEVLEQAQSYRLIPPHHADAIQPQDAYRLEELVPEIAWETLESKRLQRAIEDVSYRDNVLRDKNIFPSFVLDHLDGITNPDSAMSQRKLKALAFLGPLMMLYDAPPSLSSSVTRGGLKGLSDQRKIQVEVLQALLDLFYERHEAGEGMTSFSRPDSKRTLLLLYVLATVLIVEGYSVDATVCRSLQLALKMSPQQLAAMFKELGCAVKTSSAGSPVKSIMVTLLPPSNPPKRLAEWFPKVRIGPKRAKH